MAAPAPVPSPTAPTTKVLLLGSTGYIGGSIFSTLVARPSFDTYTLSALVRQPYQASILRDAGADPLIFNDLDDVEAIRNAAGEVDTVIAAASARHAVCARACLEGLGKRKRDLGGEVYYIHTAGTSMLGDWPVSGERIDTEFHSDIDDVFELERGIPEGHSPVREVNQLVVELGEKEGVNTFIVAPPLIFGPGTGSFTLGFGQIHMVVQLSLKHKQAMMLGSGSGIWNRVHIQDLSNLYSLLLEAILSKQPNLPCGKQGYYFAENGFFSWESLSERIGKAGLKLGIFATGDVREVSLEETAAEFYNGDLRDAEGVLGSNARTKADKARQVLDWSPKYGEDTFLEEIEDVVAVMVEEAD